MTVASLIERLKQVPTHPNTPEKTPGVLVKNEAVRGENRQNTPNTPNTPEKAGGQSANQKLPPSWTAPAPLPDPGLPRLLSAVVASPSPPVPAQTWREADKADQLHYWNCAQCLAVVKSGTGKRCTTGQQLHDAYIEAASRERFIGAKPDPAKPLPKFHHAQPWCEEADRAFQAHYWQCPQCKAGGRSRGPLCLTGQQLQQAVDATRKGVTE